MMKQLYYFLLLLFSIPMETSGQNDKLFIMVHLEAGRDTTHPLINEIVYNELGYPPDSLMTNSLYFQDIFWPSVVHLIQTADTFNVKITLALQSQMAEYILQDTNKINIFRKWINNGHEFAMHHHGVNHIDWGGYTNRYQGTAYPDDYMWLDKYLNSGLYRGNMQDSFRYLQQLAFAINDSIVTGCITDTQIDKPEQIIYLTEGGKSPNDLIAKPDTLILPNEIIYFLSHFQIVSVSKDDNNEIIEDDIINRQKAMQSLNYVIDNFGQQNDNEVMGIVFHAFDYYRFPDIYRDLFSFISQNSVNNRSIRCLMNNCNTTGMDADFNSNYIHLFPNPTNGTITVQGKEIHTVEITNIRGQLIKQISSKSETFSIDISDKPAGIYMVKLISNTGIIVKKVILK